MLNALSLPSLWCTVEPELGFSRVLLSEAAVEGRALRLAVDVLTQLIELRGGFQRNFAAAQKDMAWAQRLISLAPESARLQIGLLLAWSRILLESGSFAEARETLEEALRQQRKLEPSVLSSRLLALIYFRLGGTYYGLGNVSSANPTVSYAKADSLGDAFDAPGRLIPPPGVRGLLSPYPISAVHFSSK